jgi:hypothetical protein
MDVAELLRNQGNSVAADASDVEAVLTDAEMNDGMWLLASVTVSLVVTAALLHTCFSPDGVAHIWRAHATGLPLSVSERELQSEARQDTNAG